MSQWPMMPLGEVCVTSSGGTPSRTHPEYFGGAIPWIKSGDLTDGDVVTCDENITEEALRNSSAKLFRKGTVLIAMYGATVGKLGLLGMDAATNQAVCGITTPDELDRGFLFYFLLSQRQKLIGQSTGGAQPNISQKIVRELLVPVPHLPEQRRIVDLLSRAEGIVRLRREAEKKAAELIPALFLALFGDPATNPKGWPVKTIGELGRVQLGRQRAPKYQTGAHTHSYVRVANVHEDRIAVSDLLSMDFDNKDFVQYRLEYGDILLNEGQSTELVGRPAMWRNEINDCCFQNTLVRFQPNPSAMNSEFALAALLHYYRSGALSQISSKTSNVAHLGAGRFAKLTLYCPPLSEQREFSSRFEDVRSIQSQQSAATAKAQASFDALLARCFSQPDAA